MGGTGSGRHIDGGVDRGGRRPRDGSPVRGVGVPEMPDGLPPDVQREWHRIVGLTSGITFSQDSDAILETARLIDRQNKMAKRIDENPADEDAYMLSLSIGRALKPLLECLGLTPSGRQKLIVPKKEDEKRGPSRLERIRGGR